MRAALGLGLLAALCALAAAQAPVASQVVTIPGTDQQVQVNVVQEQGVVPAAPPRPPGSAVPPPQQQPAANGFRPSLPLLGALPCSGRPDCVNAAAPLLAQSAPAAMPFVFPAANTGLQSASAVQTALANSQLPCGGAVPCNGAPTWLVETRPGARIVPDLAQAQNACSCPCMNPCPCQNPCGKPISVTEELNSRLTDIKNDIVRRAQILQADNAWVKQVKAVIDHYRKKIEAVQKNSSTIKADIKKLFERKAKYEALLQRIQNGGEQMRRQAERELLHMQLTK